jgi:protein kinase C substrate 80K-H
MNRASVALLLVYCGLCSAFFEFLKSAVSGGSSSTSPPALQTPQSYSIEADRLRGVPEQLYSKYSQEPFLCDNDKRRILGSWINDGYCDCSDNSDEPGTSACTRGTFSCLNKGYKGVTIPSSRVDDSVCDCCDGSDEGVYIKCTNRCDEMAENEKAAQAKLIKAFKSGNELRHKWSNEIKEKLEREVNADSTSTTNSVSEESLKAEISRLEESIKEQESIISNKEKQVEKEVKNKISKLLKFTSYDDAGNPNNKDYTYIAGFLSSLSQTLNIDEFQLSNYLSDPPSSSSSSSSSSSLSNHGEEERGSYEDDYDISTTVDGSPEAASIAVDTTTTTATDSTNDNNKDLSDTCDLVEITGNSNLRVLCDVTNKRASIMNMIYSILKENHPYYETMLISGYYKLHNSFIGADIFTKNQISSFGVDSCPVEFEKLQSGSYCEMKELIKDLVNAMEHIVINDDTSIALQLLKDQKSAIQDQLNAIYNAEATAKQAKEQLEKYENKLQFLAMKGQCFDANDGKFSYSLCVLESVKQKELHGHNTVTLGDYNSIEESNDHGFSYKMKFTNGQHCHAFGPRSAEVTVVCGEENVLKSANEPSTCFYTLVFESPAACTDQFATANNLLL